MKILTNGNIVMRVKAQPEYPTDCFAILWSGKSIEEDILSIINELKVCADWNSEIEKTLSSSNMLEFPLNSSKAKDLLFLNVSDLNFLGNQKFIQLVTNFLATKLNSYFINLSKYSTVTIVSTYPQDQVEELTLLINFASFIGKFQMNKPFRIDFITNSLKNKTRILNVTNNFDMKVHQNVVFQKENGFIRMHVRSQDRIIRFNFKKQIKPTVEVDQHWNPDTLLANTYKDSLKKHISCKYCGSFSFNLYVSSCYCSIVSCEQCIGYGLCSYCFQKFEFKHSALLERMVANIPIKCSCDAIIKLSDVRAHKAKCSLLYCKVCQVQLKRQSLFQHFKEHHRALLLNYFT